MTTDAEGGGRHGSREGRSGRRPRVKDGRGRPSPDRGEGSGPSPVSEALGAFLRKHGLEGEVEGQAALARWEGVVGERIARIARPTGVARGILFVEVTSSAWITELNLMRHDILRRLNAAEGGGRVDRILFRLSEDPDSGHRGA